MSEAPARSLSSYIRIKHGFAFPGAGFSDDPSLPTLVTPGNFALGGGFKETRTKTYAGDYPSEYKLSAGDLIISMTDLSKEGDTLGLPAIVPEGEYLHNQRVGLVEITDPESVDSRFLSYFLRISKYRDYILGTASGSTVRHTSPSRIGAFETVLPPLAEQHAIAEVLSALDNKIAANTKLVATAEKLATAEFHRHVLNVPFSDRTFGDLAKVSGGGTPSTSVPEFWNGDVRWATPTDVTGLQGPYLTDTSRQISEAGLKACASELYPAGSILMTSRATIGAFALAREPMAVNQGFIVVQPHDPGLRLWLFHEMRSRVDEFISLANGATFLELSRGNFKKFKVRLADAQVMKDFASLAEPIHEMAANALLENAKLSATRDTLLPRLMAGELQVKEGEKALAEAVV